MTRLLPIILLLLSAFFAPATSPPAPPIRVRILDQAGAAIEGATFETFADSHAGRATGDADGWCVLALTSDPGPAFRGRVEARGFFHQDQLYSRVSELTVKLFRAVPMSGRVLARDSHQPIDGATVELVHPFCRGCKPDRATCDGEGRFTFAAVPLDAQATFFASGDGFAKQAFVLALAGPTVAHDFELARGFEVHGKVIDYQSGAPLAKVRVATRGKVEVDTTSDDAGRFALRVLPDAAKGRVNLETETEGYCKLRFVVRGQDAGNAKELELPLFRPAFIEGDVVDAQGHPLAGAQVAVREDNDWLDKRRASPIEGERVPLDELPADWFVASGHPNTETTSDADGHFRTQGVVPWSPKVLMQVESGSTPRFTFDAGPVGAPGSTLSVHLAPPAPPSGPRVSGTLRVNSAVVIGGIEWKGATRSGTAWLDPGGSFEGVGVELGDLALHPVKLQNRTITYGSLFDAEVAHVSVAADRDARHDFDLKCELASICGRVVTTSGKPCAKVAVSASESEHDTRGSGVTDDQGAFTLTVPKVAGPWRVVAVYGPEVFEKNAATTGDPIVFEVPDLGRGSVRFVDRQTRAVIVPASLTWRRVGDARFQRRDLVLDPLTEDGRWNPFQIPYGEFEVLAWTPRPGYAPEPLRKLVVREGEPAPQLEFELEMGFGIDLALAPDSGPASHDDHERVWLVEASPVFFGDAKAPWTRDNVALPTYADRTRRVEFDSSNRARVAGLRPGRHRFVSYTSKLRIEPAEIEVASENQRFLMRVVRAP